MLHSPFSFLFFFFPCGITFVQKWLDHIRYIDYIYSKMVSSCTKYEKFVSRNAQSSFNSLPAVHFDRRLQPG